MNIRVSNYLAVDQDDRMAKIQAMTSSTPARPPHSVLAVSHALFCIDTGECLKWRGAEPFPSLSDYLAGRHTCLDEVPVAHSLSTKAVVPTVYAYVEPTSGFYCGHSTLDAS